MKRFFIIILFLCSIIIPLNVYSLVEKSEYEFVTDEGKLLSNETINYIIEYSSFLYESEKIDYYVVTVDNLSNYSIEDYTNNVYEEFDISDKGLLILVSKSDRKMRVKVGSDLSDIIPSQIIDEYIEQFFMPEFKNDDWDSGIKNGYFAFYKMLCNYYDIDSSEVEVYDDSNLILKYKNPIIFLIIWFNTLIGYIFSEYFIRLFMNKDKSNVNMDTVIFGICLFISMLLLNLTYLINPKAIIIVLGFELVAIFSNMYNHNNKKIRKKKRKR